MLRRGKHIVTVRTAETKLGPRGQIVEEWHDAGTFRANIQPVSSSEREAIGVNVETVYRLLYFPQVHGSPWPGGAYSRITWNGREYDQLGEAMLSSMSSRTGHVRILMKARGSGVK